MAYKYRYGASYKYPRAPKRLSRIPLHSRSSALQLGGQLRRRPAVPKQSLRDSCLGPDIRPKHCRGERSFEHKRFGLNEL